LTKSRIQLGISGEKEALHFLEKNSFTIQTTNFRNQWGEIDAIASKDKSLYFIEIKKRNKKSPEFHPIHSFNLKKQSKMILLAEKFIEENPLFSSHDCEFCLIVVYPKQEVEFYSSLEFNFNQANPNHSRFNQ
jgi:putative endonuclease